MTDFSSIRSNVAIQNAFTKARDLTSEGANASGDVTSPKGSSFSDVLQSSVKETVETVRQAEQSATAGMTGQASMQQVVEATMAMESTVKVSVALRDKLVEAYQEIMRMPI